MTCILGIEHDECVILAADRAQFDDVFWTVRAQADPKLIVKRYRLNDLTPSELIQETLSSQQNTQAPYGEMVIGSCGSLLVDQALRWFFNPGAFTSGEPERYMNNAFLTALDHALERRGVTLDGRLIRAQKTGADLKDDEDADSGSVDTGYNHSGYLLVAFEGSLWRVDGELSVSRMASGYDAVGASHAASLVALHVIMGEARSVNVPRNDLQRRALMALRATEAVSAAVCGPFDVVELERETRRAEWLR